jgi:hypothetical protein
VDVELKSLWGVHFPTPSIFPAATIASQLSGIESALLSRYRDIKLVVECPIEERFAKRGKLR